MFKKLFAYDFKDIFRRWWIFAAVCLGVNVIGAVALKLNNWLSGNAISAMITTLIMIAAFGGAAAICFFVPIAVGRNFSVSTLSDQGYLTLMLPVKRKDIYISKLVVAVTFMVMTGAVLALVGVIYTLINLGFSDTLEMISFIPVENAWRTVLNAALLLTAAALFTLAFAAFVLWIVAGYHLNLKRFGLKKVIVFAVLIYLALQILPLFFIGGTGLSPFSILWISADIVNADTRAVFDTLTLALLNAAGFTLFSAFRARTLFLLENKLDLI